MIDARETEIVKDLLIACYQDFSKYASYFYPDRFDLNFTSQHRELFKALDARVKLPNGEVVPKYNKIAVKGWRGFGKTAIAKTLVARSIRYDEYKLIVYIGKSHDWASLQTENIKRGMLQNKRENEIFGSIRVSSASREIQETFSKKAWTTSTGCLVVPRGCQQPVRGLNQDWEGETHRVELAIIDDLEDPYLITSDEYRRKTKEWLLADVSEAVPLPGKSKKWQIIYLDTLKHEDSTLEMLMNSSDWKTFDFSACDESYNSLVPEFISTEEIEKKVSAHRERGTLDVFYREFMGMAVSTESAVFRASYFKYYDEFSPEFQEQLKKGLIENVILVDPAKTVKKTSAESAIIGVGVNTKDQRIYVRDIVSGRFHPDELYDHIFNMAVRLSPCHVIGIEVNSLNEFIEYPLKNEMLSRGLNYEIVPLKPRRSVGTGRRSEDAKADRISMLEPFYRKGQIYHNRHVCGALETQLLSFPRPKRWDIMDAFAYIIQLLELGLRYFEPPEREEVLEEEYAELELEEEEPIEDWRII